MTHRPTTTPRVLKRRRTRRRHTSRRRLSIALAACGLVVAALAAAVIVRSDPAATTQADLVRLVDAYEAALQTETEAAGRPVYRHSVIPGGVFNAEELADTMRRDPLVASHYEGVIANAMRAEIVPQDRHVYVSYRKDGRIYWTRNPVLLREGETILTDGRLEIRARCGNCISEVPMMPVADSEPDPIELDRLVEDNPAAGGAAASLLVVPPSLAGGSGATAPLPGPWSMPPAAEPLIGGSLIPGADSLAPPRAGIDASPVLDPPLLAPSRRDGAPPYDSDPPGLAPTPDEDGPLPPSNSPPSNSSPDSGEEHPARPPYPNPLPLPPGLLDPPSGFAHDPFPQFPGMEAGPQSVGTEPPFGSEPPFGPKPPFGPYPPGQDGQFPVESEDPIPVPEPGTILLVGGGAAAALLRRLRSRRT